MVDCGGAPCVYRNVLSLAICKPAIRSTCEEGDWLLGFGSKTRLQERLIYIAQITNKYSNGDYYREKRLKSRPDNIYRWTRNRRLVWEKGSLFHENGNISDIGVYPEYKRANVLISSNFRYFGEEGTDYYKVRFSTLGNAIQKLKRGHRVRHSEALASDMSNLIKWAWKSYDKRKIGEPSDSDKSANCSRIEGVLSECECY